MRMLFLFCLCFSYAGLQAQQVAGEYFIPAQNGEIVLRLQQPAPGQVTGTMTDLNGVQYTVQAREEAGDVMGTLTNAQGGMYFEAYPEGDELFFTLIPPDASQQPNYDQAQSFTLKRRGSAGISAAPQPDNSAGSFGGPLGGETASTGQSSWDGTFSGNINGTPATLTTTANGQQLSGNINAGGYIYQLSGTISGSQSQGQMTDPQTQGQMNYSGVLNGEVATFTIDAGGGAPLQLQFTRGGSDMGNSFQSYGGGNQGGASTAAPKPRFGSAPQAGGNQGAAPATERDSRLVGGWLYTDSYTSGEYSFASQWRLIINADGTYLYGDAKVAGGGGGVSGQSGGGEMTRGQWRTQNGVIHINDGTGWQPYARYTTDGGSLLMQFGDGSKQLWKRN